MCPPVIAGLTVASSLASLYMQNQNVKATNEANQRQYENSMQAYRANVNQTNLAATQEREAAMSRMEDNNLKARDAMAKATTASGEAGVSGLSVDALMSDVGTKQNRFNTSVETNYDRALGAIENQRQNVYANAASTINGLKTPAAPDYLGAGLRIAEAGQKAKWWGQ